MGQPVKLSDQLVSDARTVSEISKRSIAGQIEFWASLGQSLEPLLRGDRVIALQQAGATRPLSELISEVDGEAGRRRVHSYLQSRPYPHFKSVSGRSGLLCKIEEDGTETNGRFVNRVFQPSEEEG